MIRIACLCLALIALALPAAARDVDVTKVNAAERAAVAQILLNRGGYDAGAPDGEPGKRTRRALDDWRADNQINGRILMPLGVFDLWSLEKRYGRVTEAEMRAAVPRGSECGDFRRGQRVEFSTVRGRSSKRETVFYGTALTQRGQHWMVRTDASRDGTDDTVYTGQAKREFQVECARLSATKF